MKEEISKIITISREFGSGGRELGRRLSKYLNFDYYDKEIISEIAANKGMEEDYVTKALENQRWKNIPLTYRRSFSSLSMHSVQVGILLEQKNVIEEIAKKGKNCVIVGRNADVILREYDPFNIFVCADMESKIIRCKERAPEDEKLTEKELKRKIQLVDKNRSKTRDIITDIPWGEKSAYNIVVNTGNWDIKELISPVAGFTEAWFKANHI